MQFEWDEQKRQEVIQKRGVYILHAANIVENQVLIRPDTREDYGEERFIALGHVDGEYFNVIYTLKGDKTRLTTAWKAGRNGEKRYTNSITG